MKKANNLFWYLAIVLFICSSCTTDMDDSTKLLRKTIATSADGKSITTLFSYNGMKLASISNDQTVVDFTYTGDLITKTTTRNKSNQSVDYVNYEYAEGQLIRVTSLDNYTVSYAHLSDGTVSYEKWKMETGKQPLKIYHGTMFFENGNLSKDERIIDTTAPGVVTTYSYNYNYDSKKNPLNNVLGYKKLLNYYGGVSINNNLFSTLTYSVAKDDQITSTAKIYKNVIIYDGDNYPIEEETEQSILTEGYLKTQYFY